MVIALIALFSSLGGVSYGLATNSIGSREVRNNSLTGADIRESSLRPATMWALVASNGELVRRSNSGTRSRRLGAGRYQVTFPRNISRCGFVVTPGSSGPLDGFSRVPANQDVGVAPSSRSRRALVYVTAFDDVTNGESGGNPPFPDVPAYVVVHC
jgi:hypothetical protein